MFNLNITNVKGNEELVMPDECSEPFVVFPSSESRNGINWTNIGTEEEKTSSGSS